MLPYFLIWVCMALLALFGRQRWSQFTSISIWIVLTLLIGLRIEVGADWFNYLPKVDQQIGAPLDFPLSQSEPGYALANWIGAKTGWGIFGANLICGGLFGAGLVRYCRQQPYPWLALTLAFPYLTLVVAMGYSRQGVAIGLELFALLALERERLLQFLTWIALAASFHGSALTMLILPMASIGQQVGRITGLVRLVLLVGTSLGLYNAILSSSIEAYQENYLEAEYQSQGALVRIALCLLPALLFLWKRRSFPISQAQRSIYTLMSWLAVAAAIGLVVSPSSTAVDRVALYLIPLQIFVGSHLPLLRLQGLSPGAWCRLLLGFSFAVLSVWLFFAAHASRWLPYRNLLFEF
jgi:hypothetical protein